MPEPRPCADCGMPLADGLEGRCPRCLLNLAFLEGNAEEGAASPSAGPHASFTAPGLGMFGDYELLAEIAHGGMGVVFKARQRSLGRVVAVKMIRAGRLASADEVQRFRTEAEAAGQLQHPNIVAIHEVGEYEGQQFFSMDYVEGRSLADKLREGPLPPSKAARYVRTLAEAVHYAHQHGVLHRDLKPSNVLIDALDQPRITDLGLAKRVERPDDLTPSNLPLGTPGYMSPEQATGKVRGITTAADIYGLGAILYDLLTGRPPFVADTPLATMQRVIEQEPKRPSALRPQVDRDLETICLKCLEKMPARRYRSAAALAEDLERWRRHEPILARPSGLWRHSVKWARRRPAVAALLATILLAAGAFVIQLTLSRARVQTALARMRIHVAEDYFTDNPSIGLAYLARVLRDDPGNGVAAERLLSALSYRHFLLPRTPPLRHAAAVSLARFSPDGHRVVTASDDGAAQVWDAQTGNAVGPALRHARPVLWAQFSSDGGRVVTASRDGTARVWNARTWQPTTPPLKHSNTVNCARFSPDDRLVATASDDRTARQWDAGTGQPVGPVLHHSGWVFLVSFSPDGRSLLTASEDGTAGIWDVHTGRRTAVMKHAGYVCATEFSADGRFVATGSYDRTARVWDAVTGAPLSVPLEHRAALRSVQFSPDGRWLLTGTMSGTAEVWDWQAAVAPSGVEREPQPDTPDAPRSSRSTSQLLAPRPTTLIELKGSAVVSARFSPDGNTLAVASVEGTIQIWSPHGGQRMVEPVRHGGAVNCLEFSPDGASLLTASADGTACLWDARRSQPLGITLGLAAEGESNAISDAVFSHDGRLAATASARGEVRVWAVPSGKAMRPEPWRHTQTVNTVRFSPDDRWLLTASRDSTARLLSLVGERPDGPVLHVEHVRPGISGAEFSPDGSKVLTGAYCSRAELWDVHTGTTLGPKFSTPTKGDIRSIAFSADGLWLAASDDGGTACTWSVTNPALAGPVLRHRDAIHIVRFSPDSQRVLTASWDATAQVWERATGQALTPPMRHQGRVVGAEFSPDGKSIVTASYDHTARLWDAQTGEPLAEPLRHHDRVLCAQFSPDGRRVATASQDGTARVWYVRTGLPASEPLRHRAGVNTVRFHPAGTLVLTASNDGTARLWPVFTAQGPAPRWLMDLTEALASRRLDEEGKLRSVSADRILAIREYLRYATRESSFVRWGKWFFSEPAERAALAAFGTGPN